MIEKDAISTIAVCIGSFLKVSSECKLESAGYSYLAQ